MSDEVAPAAWIIVSVDGDDIQAQLQHTKAIEVTLSDRAALEQWLEFGIEFSQGREGGGGRLFIPVLFES